LSSQNWHFSFEQIHDTSYGYLQDWYFRYQPAASDGKLIGRLAKLHKRVEHALYRNEKTTLAEIDALWDEVQNSEHPLITTNPYRKKEVNARMLAMMQANPECRGWTAKQWGIALKCREPSVVATKTWKDLRQFREDLKARVARDRRGRGAGRRKGEYESD
jgi:hypothetical protein